MSCPRCGFHSHTEPCRLCGLTGFDAFEMKRFNDSESQRFEITVIVTGSPLPPLPEIHELPSIRQVNDREESGRDYIFFPDTMIRHVAKTIHAVAKCCHWNLLINGRERPYARELWLPLMEMVEQG
ncbi:hypothetical protein JXA80_10610 [bacterium]|nr:hypothetical protein [candidate division CSSED10-310 bacterium]